MAEIRPIMPFSFYSSIVLFRDCADCAGIAVGLSLMRCLRSHDSGSTDIRTSVLRFL